MLWGMLSVQKTTRHMIVSETKDLFSLNRHFSYLPFGGLIFSFIRITFNVCHLNKVFYVIKRFSQVRSMNFNLCSPSHWTSLWPYLKTCYKKYSRTHYSISLWNQRKGPHEMVIRKKNKIWQKDFASAHNNCFLPNYIASY